VLQHANESPGELGDAWSGLEPFSLWFFFFGFQAIFVVVGGEEQLQLGSFKDTRSFVLLGVNSRLKATYFSLIPRKFTRVNKFFLLKNLD
jgi:hypothetical protein